MPGWMYLVIALLATGVVAFGLSLLVRPEVDRNAHRQQPRWVKARAAATVAAGGAAAVSSMPPKKRKVADEDKDKDKQPNSEKGRT